MLNLTPAERRSLKARAHHLQPVVMIGEAGLTAPVLAEVETSLKSHELIKIRVLGNDRTTRSELLKAICDAAGAHPVQQIGRMLVVYRPKPPEMAPESPRAHPAAAGKHKKPPARK
jgi:putative YhbY family RNA-binding protein